MSVGPPSYTLQGGKEIVTFITFNNISYSWIPPAEEDRLRERDLLTGIGASFAKPNDEDDESYDFSGYPWGPVGGHYRVHSPICGRVGPSEGIHQSTRGDAGPPMRQIHARSGHKWWRGVDFEEQKMHKRSLKGNLQRSKISLKTTTVYEDEMIKLNTLKTRRIVC
ncbi:hypothetical protein M9H77_26909 [Catharanthus roseus]|uniref:Uncharacterized protein n=1 Tax=Catharanthus roseus TaxID=4058 RepID=A0ACC0AC09_CATRO|nr:hypothetical protein M9H77_26909 [Catharanthus roseus]